MLYRVAVTVAPADVAAAAPPTAAPSEHISFKVRWWVAVHVPEVCVQNGEFCSNAGSLNHSIKCNKDMYVLCEFKNILYDVKVSPNYFVHALSHVFR